jgi:hypothetical protein
MSATMRAALDAMTYLDSASYESDVDVDLVLTDIRSRAREALSRAEQESNEQLIALRCILKIAKESLS